MEQSGSRRGSVSNDGLSRRFSASMARGRRYSIPVSFTPPGVGTVPAACPSREDMSHFEEVYKAECKQLHVKKLPSVHKWAKQCMEGRADFAHADFSTLTTNCEQIRALMKAYVDSDRCEGIDLHGVDVTDAAGEAMGRLFADASIAYANFDFCTWESPAGAVALIEGLAANPHLRSVSFNGNWTSEERWYDVFRALPALVCKGAALEERFRKQAEIVGDCHLEQFSVTFAKGNFSIGRCTEGCVHEPMLELLRAIGGSRLRSVNLSYCELNASAADALGDMVRQLGTLEELVLVKNMLHDEGVTTLAAGLAANKSLRRLNLYGTHCGREGIAALCKVLAPHTALAELNFGMNGVKEASVAPVCEVLLRNRHLREFVFSSNMIGGPAGAELMAALLENPSLERIDVSSNILTDSNAAAVCELIRTSDRLSHLYIGANQFSEASCDKLADAIEENHTLVVVELAQCNAMSQAAGKRISRHINTTRQEVGFIPDEPEERDSSKCTIM